MGLEGVQDLFRVDLGDSVYTGKLLLEGLFRPGGKLPRLFAYL